MHLQAAQLVLLLGGAGAVAVAAVALWHARRTRRALSDAVADRDRVAAELSRRLGELYSLQELTHVLSSSLLFDQVAADVARYATQFLDAAGGAVVLASAEGEPPRVVAAEGSLAPFRGLTVALDQGGVVLDAIAHERVELRTASGKAGLRLFGAVDARSAAVAPLKAHGVTDGAVVVVDKRADSFVIEDARLLSTVAAHAAVALANARLFDLVRRGKEQWEATFDAISEGMALVDDGAVIRRANTAFAAIVGRPVTAVVGAHLCHLLFGEHLALAQLMHATAGGAQRAPLVRRSESLGRVLRIVAASVARAVDGASAVVVVEDISEQQMLEAQLIQSEKMAAVGTLVSGVAHELNNPLTSIAGLSEFLLEQPPGAELERRHLQVISEEAARAGRIVRDLLTFSRKGPAERAAVDLGDVVQRTVQLMAYEMKHRGVTVVTRVAPGLPAVMGDRYQLQQVVLNLLSNSAHVLSTLPPGRPRQVEVAVAAEGSRVVLRVIDTGPGLTPEVKAQMFSPFFTTKAPGEGTGLGLFVSYGIAEAHRGTLTAESRPGEGATLILNLPAADAAPAPPPGAGVSAAAPAAAARRILVVDDDPAVRRVVTALFSRDGHRVDATGSGAEALRLAREARFDLIVADRRAAADGVPLSSALAQLPGDPSQRLILSTSDPRRGDERPDTRAPRLLRKPFDLRDLKKAAEEVFGRSE
ncbi:MAG TPA: ATP-binding protein [Gemmatimonadales bacterium]|nr:ATP-binding protein [Gemmatimonadales bacterium]